MTGEGYSLVEREVHGLLGTVVRLTLSADSSATADTMAESMIRETERLQSVFNVFDPGSQLRRWQRGVVDVGAEISEVLHLADQWQIRSRGAFDSHVGRLREVWAAAAAEGRLPKAAEVAAARREWAYRFPEQKACR